MRVTTCLIRRLRRHAWPIADLIWIISESLGNDRETGGREKKPACFVQAFRRSAVMHPSLRRVGPGQWLIEVRAPTGHDPINVWLSNARLQYAGFGAPMRGEAPIILLAGELLAATSSAVSCGDTSERSTFAGKEDGDFKRDLLEVDSTWMGFPGVAGRYARRHLERWTHPSCRVTLAGSLQTMGYHLGLLPLADADVA